MDPRVDGDECHPRTGRREDFEAQTETTVPAKSGGGGGGVRIFKPFWSRYALGLVLALATGAFIPGNNGSELDTHARHRRPEIKHPPPRIDPALEVGQNHTGALQPGSEGVGSNPDGTPWLWVNAGGRYGLSCDWREAVSTPGANGGPATIRAEECAAEEKQELVREILDRRRRAPPDGRVAACVRTKDFGRFLPEWLAFHYAVGVDEFVVNDDDSVDGTREVLEPFVRAGLVMYKSMKLESRKNQMKPLNDCLESLLARRKVDHHAPRWLLMHDTDEYMYPANNSQALFDALRPFDAYCCRQVNRIQYGSAGYRETPRGLTIENFLTHAKDKAWRANRLPKIVLNVEPTSPELGTVSPPLSSMHGVKGSPGGCTCKIIGLSTVRINHYLGSVGDFVDKTRRYWQENHSVDRVERFMHDRDVNEVMTDDIVHWACATREILARAAEGLDLATGEPLASLNSSNKHGPSTSSPTPLE
ncbi:unnamed protein product [Ascophyllum nodosum]